MDITRDLEVLCDLLSEKIGEKIRKIKGGGMTDGDLDTLDKLTHTMASVKKIMAFMEDEDGYSGMYRGSYGRGSYARKRDSMGRYSGEYGYSRNDLADKMRDLMKGAPDDRTREEMRRMIEKLEA